MLEKPTAAQHFSENLPVSVFKAARRGVRELYSAALNCYEVSGGEILSEDIYKSWLQDQTYIYEAMGEEEGFNHLMDTIPDVSNIDPDSFTRYTRYVSNKEKQRELLVSLQDLVTDKEGKNSSTDIVDLLGQMQELNSSTADPLATIENGLDISSRAENMWDLPTFIPTQFKSLNEAIGYDPEKGGFCRGAVHSIIASSGKGKPLDVNTKILMADGSYKRLGDIEVGDRVINRKGKPDNVIEVHEQGVLPTLILRTFSGREIKTAFDHTFLTTGGWKEAQKLEVDDTLVLVQDAKLDSHPTKDFSAFKEAGKQGKYMIPDWVETGAQSQIASFIAAMLADCGRIVTLPNGKLPIIDFRVQGPAAKKLQSLLQRMGIHTVREEETVTVVDAYSCKLFVEKMPLIGHNKAMADKWLNRPKSSNFKHDKIVAIEISTPSPCRCLTVAEDHTFVANDFVVHNSTFAKSLMNHWVDNGLVVLYVNYEEATQHWERVLFTQVTKQNVYKAGGLDNRTRAEYTKLFKQKMEEWNGRFLVKHNPETQYFEDLEDWIRSLYRVGKVKPDVIIVDTIQSMFLKGNSNATQRWGQYEVMMTRLEKLGKDTDAAIVITAQENRDRIKDGREVVKQSDAGGSLTIIQKSSAAIFITDVGSEDGIGSNIMQLQIPKSRITGDEYAINPPLVKYNDDFKLYEDLEITPETVSEEPSGNFEDFL